MIVALMDNVALVGALLVLSNQLQALVNFLSSALKALSYKEKPKLLFIECISSFAFSH